MRADLDRRPHNPRQDIQTRQSLPARSVCPGGLGRTDQADEGALRARNASAPQDHRINVRLGVSLGDVIVVPNDICGHSVNVAVRRRDLPSPRHLSHSECLALRAREISCTDHQSYEATPEKHHRTVCEKRYLLRDRDAKYTACFLAIIESVARLIRTKVLDALNVYHPYGGAWSAERHVGRKNDFPASKTMNSRERLKNCGPTLEQTALNGRRLNVATFCPHFGSCGV